MNCGLRGREGCLERMGGWDVDTDLGKRVLMPQPQLLGHFRTKDRDFNAIRMGPSEALVVFFWSWPLCSLLLPCLQHVGTVTPTYSPRVAALPLPHVLITPVFLPTQRKTLDLSLQPAATPSSGKTLPIPVQITLRFNLPKEREAVPGSPDQPLSSSSCVQPNHRSTVRTGARPPRLALFVSLSTRHVLNRPHQLGGVGLGLGWQGRPPGIAQGHHSLHLEGILFPPMSNHSCAGLGP